ncbi:restriction endonuclease [Kitasatospora sp. NPDC101155]|uniref:restriction endonuclease n=1 Tax=Kitasatospora sp. NPDC101155 TaxID=3364097 RepID=UPI0038306661
MHGAAVPVVVALNGFTDPAAAFATRQRLHLVDREDLHQVLSLRRPQRAPPDAPSSGAVRFQRSACRGCPHAARDTLSRCRASSASGRSRRSGR